MLRVYKRKLAKLPRGVLGLSMKTEQYVYALIMFLALFLVQYCLGRINLNRHEQSSGETHTYNTQPVDLFRSIKLKKVIV
jgi:hypothetical protein